MSAGIQLEALKQVRDMYFQVETTLTSEEDAHSYRDEQGVKNNASRMWPAVTFHLISTRSEDY